MAISTITTLDRHPFKHLTTGVGNLPTMFQESMSYYEMLAWLCQFVEETLIPQINLNSSTINTVIKDMNDLRAYVDEQIAEIPQLRADFETLVEKMDAKLVELQEQYEAFEVRVDTRITREIANVRISLMNIMSGYRDELNAKIDRETLRLENEIKNIDYSKILVFNSLRGYNTSLQEYLDDLAGVNRQEAITASEYDELELTATTYDDKQISAYEYDYFGKTILITA